MGVAFVHFRIALTKNGIAVQWSRSPDESRHRLDVDEMVHRTEVRRGTPNSTNDNPRKLGVRL